MKEHITIELEEAKRVFDLIEKLHHFIHQPMHYSDIEQFSEDIYPELKDVYYNIVWNWLPDHLKNEIEER